MSKIDTTVLKDGQLAVATLVQNGTPITGPSAVDTTVLVETEQGPQLCVKTYSVGGGGGADTNLSNLTDTGKIQVAHLALPSGTYEDVSLPASDGGEVTAPADGYFAAEASATTSFCYFFFKNLSNGMCGGVCTHSNGDAVRPWVPAKKGDKVKVDYININLSYFRFIYAEGAKTEAN